MEYFEIDRFTLESDISEIYFPFEHESMFLFLFFIPQILKLDCFFFLLYNYNSNIFSYNHVNINSCSFEELLFEVLFFHISMKLITYCLQLPVNTTSILHPIRFCYNYQRSRQHSCRILTARVSYLFTSTGYLRTFSRLIMFKCSQITSVPTYGFKKDTLFEIYQIYYGKIIHISTKNENNELIIEISNN